MDNQRNIFNFSEEAKAKVGPLMLAYSDPRRNLTIALGTKITVEWNPDSNFVFIISTDFRIALLDPKSNTLRDWHRCLNPQCYFEGFQEDLERANDCCKAHIAEELSRLKAA